MFRIKFTFILSSLALFSFSQNDADAIRYSRSGFGGTSRFMSMGGAFGAVGADVSVGAYNPAGLGIFRKGQISFSSGFKAINNSSDIYRSGSSAFDLYVAFNNFGLAYAWGNENDPDSRHVLSFSNTQIQNFNNSVHISGNTNSSSIAKDMLNLANDYKSKGTDITTNLLDSYERMAFNTYLLDTADNVFYSNLDLKRTVKQTRDISTTGRVNDLSFSYAYAFKDKFYFGLSLGVPQVKYESTIRHTEADELDSMRVFMNPDSTFSDTYVDGLPVHFSELLGFNSLEYVEYFKTKGSGINLKLGGIVRVSDLVRLGFYYHTPTLYNLQDSYYNSLSVSYDKYPKDPYYITVPENGGVYKYRLITPGKVSTNLAFIIKKIAVLALDYEFVDYRSTRLVGDKTSDFENVNKIIKTDYKGGHNIRLGGELNLNPFMLRLGYNMQGSPFGKVFVGDLVRNTFSGGFGFRTKSNFYFDFVVYQTLSNEKYYLFTTLNTAAKINYTTTGFAATVGIKF